MVEIKTAYQQEYNETLMDEIMIRYEDEKKNLLMALIKGISLYSIWKCSDVLFELILNIKYYLALTKLDRLFPSCSVIIEPYFVHKLGNKLLLK